VQCAWQILPDADVTSEISARASELLSVWRATPSAVPGVTSSEEWTGPLYLSYRYEWHPPDAQNPDTHTGTTVYECPGAVRPAGQAGVDWAFVGASAALAVTLGAFFLALHKTSRVRHSGRHASRERPHLRRRHPPRRLAP
jgi:hypothetical protein